MRSTPTALRSMNSPQPPAMTSSNERRAPADPFLASPLTSLDPQSVAAAPANERHPPRRPNPQSPSWPVVVIHDVQGRTAPGGAVIAKLSIITVTPPDTPYPFELFATT